MGPPPTIAVEIHDDFLSDLKFAGVLVPDIRLEAITDAWNATDAIAKRECFVTPRLAALLDALTKENTAPILDGNHPCEQIDPYCALCHDDTDACCALTEENNDDSL
jgi:hypothetical protein